MKSFRKILVPVDFSPHSERAVRMAAEFAGRHKGSLDLLHVYDPVAYPLPEGYVMLTKSQHDRLFAEFDRELVALKGMANSAGANQVDTHIRQGLIAQDICDFAKEGAFDLIVMGTHGRTGLRHLLLGSVAERVVRSAPCPVLTVKAASAGAGVKTEMPAAVQQGSCCS